MSKRRNNLTALGTGPEAAEALKKRLRRDGVLHVYRRVRAGLPTTEVEVVPGQSHAKAWAAVTEESKR